MTKLMQFEWKLGGLAWTPRSGYTLFRYRPPFPFVPLEGQTAEDYSLAIRHTEMCIALGEVEQKYDRVIPMDATDKAPALAKALRARAVQSGKATMSHFCTQHQTATGRKHQCGVWPRTTLFMKHVVLTCRQQGVLKKLRKAFNRVLRPPYVKIKRGEATSATQRRSNALILDAILPDNRKTLISKQKLLAVAPGTWGDSSYFETHAPENVTDEQ